MFLVSTKKPFHNNNYRQKIKPCVGQELIKFVYWTPEWVPVFYLAASIFQLAQCPHPPFGCNHIGFPIQNLK